jgi:hypothetical protein
MFWPKCRADPDFPYAALDTTACAAFIKESRKNFANANHLHRKSGLAAARISDRRGTDAQQVL